jgi:hypothetical protein
MNPNTALVTAVLMAALTSSNANAQAVIDQLQPIIDGSVGGLGIGGASQQKLGQTLVAKNRGELRAVYLPVACTSGELVLEIRNVETTGKPGSIVLAYRTYPAASLPSVGALFRRLEISGAFLNAGDRYSIVVSNSTGSCGMFRASVGDGYYVGEGFFDSRPNPPGWVPFSQFPHARRDLPFLVEVTPM